jgi:hypothetical protein
VLPWPYSKLTVRECTSFSLIVILGTISLAWCRPAPQVVLVDVEAPTRPAPKNRKIRTGGAGRAGLTAVEGGSRLGLVDVAGELLVRRAPLARPPPGTGTTLPILLLGVDQG